MSVRVVPVADFGAIVVSEGYELIDFVTYRSTVSRVWAVLARRQDSAAVVSA